MPTTPTYPGVYIEEVPSGVRTIVGVPTSITAFIGRARRGPVDEPVRIQSMAEFERRFGGLWEPSTMSYAVQHYFLNGGTDAIIVRIVHKRGEDEAEEVEAASATVDLPGGEAEEEEDTLTLEAANPGSWGNNLQVTVDYDTKDPERLFNITVEETDPDDPEEIRQAESFRNLSIVVDADRFVSKVLEQESVLIRVEGDPPDVRPNETREEEAAEGEETPPLKPVKFSDNGRDGAALKDTDFPGSEGDKTGLYALEKADLFNLLCIPPPTRNGSEISPDTLSKALAYCKKRRAMLIVDPRLSWNSPSQVTATATGVDTLNLRDENAAVYFPRIKMGDPNKENRLEEFVPSGAVAGVFARTDRERGVWKAPAGQDATLTGVRGLSYKLTDGENGRLNPLGVNCLRTFPVIGNVIWGARTLEGADRLASEWKYVPVRRLALFIEETLYRGTHWVVFEPNDEPLWAQIRLNIGSFMHNLFRQGAFQGTSPRDAYFVKCDKETTTQADIDRGIVNILVGFAPLKPAEFVIIKISQIAGQTQA